MTQPFRGNFETVLLVEGHSALCRSVKDILRETGPPMILAKDAREAIRLEAEFPGTIDLLVSDMRSEGMSGPNLAKRLKERRPHMRVMLVSGYPGGALLLLDHGWQYIRKPSVDSVLVSKIKEILLLRVEARGELTEGFDSRQQSRRTFGRAHVQHMVEPRSRHA